MTDNIDRISFGIGNLTKKQIAAHIKAQKEIDGLIPLADAPDLVWKTHKDKVWGGRDHGIPNSFRTTGPDHVSFVGGVYAAS